MLAILKVDFTVSVIIATVVIFVYIYYGGMVATTFSTAFQGVAMTVASVTAAHLRSSSNYGGLNGLTEAVLANSPNFFNMPYVAKKASHPIMSMWSGVVGFFFVWHFGFSAMPTRSCAFSRPRTSSRPAAASSGRSSIGGAMYCGLVIIGTGARVLIESLHR
jgi:Na+(H+)/acetate symporter ActP